MKHLHALLCMVHDLQRVNVDSGDHCPVSANGQVGVINYGSIILHSKEKVSAQVCTSLYTA